jgi:hypothetical protein
MKKLFSFVFLIILSFYVSAYADDVRDFEIDGMSIGDSLLDYFSKDKILNARNYDEYPSDMKFRIIDIYPENKFYEGIQFYYIPGDEKFIIQSLNGRKFFSDIKNCYTEKKKIEKVLSSKFDNAIINRQKKEKHMDDPTGKSTYTATFFNLKGEGRGSVTCYDWYKDTGYNTSISVSIQSKSVANWVDSNFGVN